MAKAPAQSAQWFRNARFGMFIHYGLYSILERHEWAMCYERIPAAEYVKLQEKFNPEQLDVNNWVQLAAAAGMRYMCLTTRHHEGFALFDSAADAFNSVNSPAQRDIVAEYTTACRTAGLGVGLYYSVADWRDPGFIAGPRKDPGSWQRFVNVAHEQLRELMSNYGRIDYLFYDGCPPPEAWDAEQINAEIRRLQPDILISDRCGLDEDVKSAEGYTIADPGKLWESCMTTNRSWGYNAGDNNWSTPLQVIQNLMTCAHNGGNFLLNIGPQADGTVAQPAIDMLTAAGAWLQQNGDAVYGTEPHPFDYAVYKLATSRGNRAYIPLHFYTGPRTVLAGIGNQVNKVTVLGGTEVDFYQEQDRIFIPGLPQAAPDAWMTILQLDLDSKPCGIPNPLLNHARYE